MPKTNPIRRRDPRRATRSLDETALLFGCGRGAVKDMAAAKLLDSISVGNKTLIVVRSIEQKLGKPIDELEGRTVASDAALTNDHAG